MANPAIIPGWSGILGRKVFGQEVEANSCFREGSGAREGEGEKRVFEKRNGQVKKRRLVVARVGFRGHRASFARSHARGRLGVGGGLPMAPAIFHN